MGGGSLQIVDGDSWNLYPLYPLFPCSDFVSQMWGGLGGGGVMFFSHFMLFPTFLEKQGNSVARDLPRTGSKTNTTIFVIYIYILDIYRFPLSISTIWGNHLPVNFMLKFPTCISTIWRNHPPHLTSKWRGTFQYFQSHDKIPYIYYLEKPPPI